MLSECMFVTGKLGSFAVYPKYDTHSESAGFQECIIGVHNSFALTVR